MTFFGVDAGSISILGVMLEHEAFGVGLIIPFLLRDSRWSRWLLLIGAILVFSEPFPFYLDYVANPYGSALSFGLGLVAAWIALRFMLRRGRPR